MEGFLVAWLLLYSIGPDISGRVCRLHICAWLVIFTVVGTCTKQYRMYLVPFYLADADGDPMCTPVSRLSRKRVQHTLSICRADRSIHCSPADVTRPLALLTGCRRCQTTPLKSTSRESLLKSSHWHLGRVYWGLSLQEGAGMEERSCVVAAGLCRRAGFTG